MIGTILACMLAVGSPVQDCNDFDKKKDNSTNEYSYDVKSDDFWDSKRSFRIGYELHNFQTESATSLPVKLGVGLSRVRQAWFHKRPIGGIMKFSFEYGLDLNYSMFETNITDDGYNGPTGFIGTEDPYYSEETEEGTLLGNIGMHYASIGYALGAGLTINPVKKLGINGYFHFVPSVSLLASGNSIGGGFTPYCKYGGNITFGKVGLGVEWGSGMTRTRDMIAVLTSKLNSEYDGAEISKEKAKYFSNFTRFYLTFKVGQKKRR